MIGDEDTVTGFLLGGIGELNKNRHPNFLVVEKDTTINEIEDTFRYGSPRGLNGTLCLGWEPRGSAGSAPGFQTPMSGVKEVGPVALPEEASMLQVLFWGMGEPELCQVHELIPHMTLCQERGKDLEMGAAPRPQSAPGSYLSSAPVRPVEQAPRLVSARP